MNERRSTQVKDGNNKTIVITGGSRGFGKVLVQAFLKENWRVAVLGRHPLSGRPAVPRCLFIKADVTQARTVKAAADRVMRKWGRIDVWINNAGGGKMVPFLSSRESDWLDVFNVNFGGVLNGCRAAIGAMLACRTEGVVINIASLAGLHACPQHSAYSTAKAAVIALTRSLAVEYARRKKRINAIAPGPMETEGFTVSGGDSQRRARFIPTRKMVSPHEIAEACLFLAKPLYSLTGHTLVIDGGSAVVGCYSAVGPQ
jgi:NAD(P)-dependent dehydrogenase (short-subunit alcohol dehydrogenase family)